MTISAPVTVMIGNFTPRSIAAIIYPGRPETIGNARIDGYASNYVGTRREGGTVPG
jgi:hypothetical protein